MGKLQKKDADDPTGRGRYVAQETNAGGDADRSFLRSDSASRGEAAPDEPLGLRMRTPWPPLEASLFRREESVLQWDSREVNLREAACRARPREIGHGTTKALHVWHERRGRDLGEHLH